MWFLECVVWGFNCVCDFPPVQLVLKNKLLEMRITWIRKLHRSLDKNAVEDVTSVTSYVYFL